MFYIVGMGPGNLNCTTSKALSCVKDADVVIGAGRLLDDIRSIEPHKTYMSLQMPYEPMIEFIRENHEKKCIVVVVTGDSGFYSLTHYIGRYFPKTVYTVLPGISSLQYLFAAIKEPWQNAPLLSLHGKEAEFTKHVKMHRFVGLLTDKQHSPQWICDALMADNLENIVIHIGENLSYAEEHVRQMSLAEVANAEFEPLLVVILENLEIE